MRNPREARLAKVTRGKPITSSEEPIIHRREFSPRTGFPASPWRRMVLHTRDNSDVPALAIHAPVSEPSSR